MDSHSVQFFIDQLFEFETETRFINDKSVLKKRIYEILTPHWLRFRSVESSLGQHIQNKINDSVDKNEPIKILNAYGGFKNPRIDTSPHIDWAEVMHISFLTHTLMKVAEIYEPGVKLEYSGDAHAAVIVDNLKYEWVDTYLDEFNQILSHFDSQTPDNFRISSRDFLDFYDFQQTKQELENLVKEVDLKSMENQKLIDKYYHRAKSNFVFSGDCDYSKLSSEEQDLLVKKSVIKAYKWYDLDFEKRGDYFVKLIVVCNLIDFPDTYCIRSVRHLPAPPFWQGKGVVAMSQEKLSAHILHVNEYLNHGPTLKKLNITSPLSQIQTLQNIQIIESN